MNSKNRPRARVRAAGAITALSLFALSACGTSLENQVADKEAAAQEALDIRAAETQAAGEKEAASATSALAQTLDGLAQALTEADIPALIALTSGDELSSVRGEVGPGWLGFDEISFEDIAFEAPAVTAPEVQEGTVPESADNEFGERYVPQVVVDGTWMDASDWEPRTYTAPEHVSVPYVGQPGDIEGELNLVREGDGWLVASGLVATPGYIEYVNDEFGGEWFAIGHLYVGDAPISRIRNVLIGMYETSTPDDWSSEWIEFPDAGPLNLASTIPTTQPTEKLSNAAIEYAKKVIDASLRYTDCTIFSPNVVSVDGSESPVELSCDGGVVPGSGEITKWNPDQVELNMRWNRSGTLDLDVELRSSDGDSHVLEAEYKGSSAGTRTQAYSLIFVSYEVTPKGVANLVKEQAVVARKAS